MADLRTRFAPSPTGPLHLGHAFSALTAFDLARAAGGTFLLRIEDIDAAKSIVLIGTNPRLESPVLNARIRKAWTLGAQVTLVGPAADLTYDVTHAGTGRAALVRLAAEAKPLDKPGIVIVGQGALTEADGEAAGGRK